jgi:SNF2 family DNA or RNA helicase
MTSSYALAQYQTEGALWLSQRHAACLADPPGMGKTAQAIRALDILDNDDCVIIGPAIARTVYAREIERWSPNRPPPFIYRAQTPNIPNTGIRIFSYDAISSSTFLTSTLRAQKPQIVIIDEAHYLKTPDSKRTRAIYGPNLDRKNGIIEFSTHVWLLSGTPAPNNAPELWPHLYALAPRLIQHPIDPRPLEKHEFDERYGIVADSPTYGRRVVGSRDPAQLKQRVKPFFLRRPKSILKLGQLRFDTYPVSIDDVAASELRYMAQDYRNAFSTAEYAPVYDALINLADLDAEEFLAALSRKQWSRQLHLLSMIKAHLAVSVVLAEITNSDRKIVLFGHHRAAIDFIVRRLQSQGIQTVSLVGGDSDEKRASAIDLFQNHRKCQVFVGQIQAAGTAITLTAASDVLFFEASTVPSENLQAASRCHRIGQKSSLTLARFLCCDDALDTAIMRILTRKARDLSQLFDHTDPTEGAPTHAIARTA